PCSRTSPRLAARFSPLSSSLFPFAALPKGLATRSRPSPKAVSNSNSIFLVTRRAHRGGPRAGWTGEASAGDADGASDRRPDHAGADGHHGRPGPAQLRRSLLALGRRLRRL